MTSQYVVRIVLDPNEADRLEVFVKILHYAGMAIVHRNDEKGMCFDLVAPAARGNNYVDSEAWAAQNAVRISTFGFNAVKAPAWETK
jgi:hypothetical protein